MFRDWLMAAANQSGDLIPTIIAQVNEVLGVGSTPVTTISIPEAAEFGDFLLVVYTTRNSSASAITNLTSGWSTFQFSSGVTSDRPRLFYKISDGTETSMTFTSASASGDEIARSWMFVIRNATEITYDVDDTLGGAAPHDFHEVSVDKSALVFHIAGNSQDTATLPVSSWSNDLGREVDTVVNYATTSGDGRKIGIGVIDMQSAGNSGTTILTAGSGIVNVTRTTFAVQ